MWQQRAMVCRCLEIVEASIFWRTSVWQVEASRTRATYRLECWSRLTTLIVWRHVFSFSRLREHFLSAPDSSRHRNTRVRRHGWRGIYLGVHYLLAAGVAMLFYMLYIFDGSSVCPTKISLKP